MLESTKGLGAPGFDPYLHHRRSIRLAVHDYARATAVFVTVCSYGREHLFGDIVEGAAQTNAFGGAVRDCWLALPSHFQGISLDDYLIMPNHVHGILIFTDDTARPAAAPGPALGTVVGSFKSAAARQINRLRATPGGPVWQRNYHEHIVSNEGELERIHDYIARNPSVWRDDEYYAPIRVP